MSINRLTTLPTMTTIIAYFNLDTDRRELENELSGSTFETLSAFLGLCEDEGWNFERNLTLQSLCKELNDEIYPVESWCVFVNIKNINK